MSIFYKGKQIAGNEVTLSEVTAQSKEEIKNLQKEGANQLAIVSKKVEEAVGVAIGTYLDIASNSTYIPSGYLLRDGAEYTKAQFSDLWDNYLTGEIKTIEEDWITTSITNAQWYDVVYGNGKFVAVGDSGYIATSVDGVIWSEPIEVGVPLVAVTYGNGKFVAVGYVGYIATSVDGANWSVTQVGNADLPDVTYANGKFVAVGLVGTIITSTDGVTWNTLTVGSYTWHGVTYANGKFVAVGYGGNTTTSTDGISWTEVIDVGTDTLDSVIYGNGKFVAVGDSGYIATSVDGANWSTTTVGSDIVWTGVTYTDNMFVAVGHSGHITTSTDGNIWTEPIQLGTKNWSGVTYANGKFVVVGFSGNVVSKRYYKAINSLLNTCSYTEYEQDLASYGFCDRFAVDITNKKFRTPLANPNTRTLVEKKEPTEADPTWYNLYNDGWCEQGGAYTGNVTLNVTLLKPYINTAYNIIISGSAKIAAHTTLGFTADSNYGFSQKSDGYWETKGYTNQVVEGSTRPYVVVANGELNQSYMDWSAWASSLQGKASTDLSNVEASQTFKDNVIDWNIPDYTAPVTLVDPAVAPSSGLIIFSVQIASDKSITLTINGTVATYTASYAERLYLPFNVSEGDTFSCSATGCSYTFYPFKGVN